MYFSIKTQEKSRIKDKEDIKIISREIKILKKVRSPKILDSTKTFEDVKNFYIITEMRKGGEPFDKIVEKEFFTKPKVAHVMKQIL